MTGYPDRTPKSALCTVGRPTNQNAAGQVRGEFVLARQIVRGQWARGIGRISGMLLHVKIALRKNHAKNGSPTSSFNRSVADGSFRPEHGTCRCRSVVKFAVCAAIK
jgi:hypothetical protein